MGLWIVKLCLILLIWFFSFWKIQIWWYTFEFWQNFIIMCFFSFHFFIASCPSNDPNFRKISTENWFFEIFSVILMFYSNFHFFYWILYLDKFLMNFHFFFILVCSIFKPVLTGFFNPWKSILNLKKFIFFICWIRSKFQTFFVVRFFKKIY